MNELPTPASPWLDRLRETRLPLWVGLLLLILLLIVFAWQRMAMGRAEARLTAGFTAERAALVDRARAGVLAHGDESRRHFAMALAWAVRGELIRNNLDQVDQYFAELVKLPGHKLVVLADANGKVVVSTDRRHMGTDAADLAPAEILNQAGIALHAEAADMKLLAIPVMGLNTRLGTVLLRVQEADPLAGL